MEDLALTDSVRGVHFERGWPVLDYILYRNGRNIELEKKLDKYYQIDSKIQKDYMIIKDQFIDNKFVWIGRGYPYRWLIFNHLDQTTELNIWYDFKESISENMANVKITDYYKNMLYESDDIIKIQGLYEEEYSDSGGPFVSYIKLDRTLKEALIITGFANNPGKNKNRLGIGLSLTHFGAQLDYYGETPEPLPTAIRTGTYFKPLHLPASLSFDIINYLEEENVQFIGAIEFHPQNNLVFRISSGNYKTELSTGEFSADFFSGVAFGVGFEVGSVNIDISTQVMFVNFGSNESQFCLPLLKQLRASGISSELYPKADKMKKQMNYANKREIPFVILAGEEEMEAEKFTLKNMKTGEQNTCNISDLIRMVKGAI